MSRSDHRRLLRGRSGDSRWRLEGSAAKTVLILDDDLGRLLPACLALARAGFDAIPSHTVREARSLQKVLGVKVDLLVANPRLRAAGSLVRRMRAVNPELRVVQLASPGEAAAGSPWVDAGGPRFLDPALAPRMGAGDWSALFTP